MLLLRCVHDLAAVGPILPAVTVLRLILLLAMLVGDGNAKQGASGGADCRSIVSANRMTDCSAGPGRQQDAQGAVSSISNTAKHHSG